MKSERKNQSTRWIGRKAQSRDGLIERGEAGQEEQYSTSKYARQRFRGELS